MARRPPIGSRIAPIGLGVDAAPSSESPSRGRGGTEPPTVEAFAIVQGGKILIDTVGPTPRAAKVNWLWTHCDVVVTNDWGDDQISKAFDLAAGFRLARVAPVAVDARDA